ncbi:hypothetical protein KBTX_02809 [wastewater metagenome]|uniref:EamA domain-containing protein n=2 Tax=unclassified sequences TaxID=12908 RepID=A0A5B8RCD5_9ZZZZ|nr:DMT family transporter [Arhodomonas sp. KWT]QEA06470.1 hypothetical protein KBTEX_02809 [uncultured organism]
MTETNGAVPANPRRLMLPAPYLFVLLWSAGFPVAKVALHASSPFVLLELRYLCAAGAMAVLFAILRPALPRGARQWRDVAVVGVLVQVVYFGLTYLSLYSGASATVVALIVSLQPILVAVFAPAVVGEHVRVGQWCGLVLGLAGAMTVILAGGGRTSLTLAGGALAAGALAGIVAAMLYERRFGVGHHPVSVNLIQYVLGAALCLPLVFLGEGHLEWTVPFAAALGYLVIGNSLVAVTLLLAMTRAGQVARVASLFFFVPPMAAVIAWIVLGEAVTPAGWLGIAVASAGVSLATRRRA